MKEPNLYKCLLGYYCRQHLVALKPCQLFQLQIEALCYSPFFFPSDRYTPLELHIVVLHYLDNYKVGRVQAKEILLI